MDHQQPSGGDVYAVADSQSPDVRTREEWSACLTRMAATQDKQLFSQLFQHFAPRVKAYILRLGIPLATAEEVTQEAMLSVWRKAHLFNADKANASTWIFTLARNLCIDRLRREKALEYELPEEEPDPDQRDMGEQRVLEQRMQLALAQLPEAQVQVLHLAYYEGKSHSEIAEQLGIPLGSVKSRLRLAFDKLKVYWGEAEA